MSELLVFTIGIGLLFFRSKDGGEKGYFPGAVAGILAGAVVNILWLVLLKDLGIYETIPGFAAGLVVTILASLCTKSPADEVTALFDSVARDKTEK